MIEAAALDLDQHTHRKVTRRLIPFLFLCYILAYLDRVNVGFARLQMQADLAFSDTAYGIGAGIFFIGYFFFEVPSNLLMRRVGARLWIARIMIVWGLVSAASMFVNSAASFYVLRFLLGVAEAGFFPGIIWYLTQWYTRAHRAHIIALFMTAIAVSGVVGGPLSGWILNTMDGVSGLRGWRWLYLLEGLPSVVIGFAVLRYLDDGPQTASVAHAGRARAGAAAPRRGRGTEAGGRCHRASRRRGIPIGSRLGVLRHLLRRRDGHLRRHVLAAADHQRDDLAATR